MSELTESPPPAFCAMQRLARARPSRVRRYCVRRDKVARQARFRFIGASENGRTHLQDRPDSGDARDCILAWCWVCRSDATGRAGCSRGRAGWRSEAVGLKPDHAEIEADWRRKRISDVSRRAAVAGGDVCRISQCHAASVAIRRARPRPCSGAPGKLRPHRALARQDFRGRRHWPVVSFSPERPLDLGPQLSGQRSGQSLFSGCSRRPSSRLF